MEQDPRLRIANTLRIVVGEMTGGPDIVRVSFVQGEKTTIYKITLEEESFRGKLIGSGGRNIVSLRQILGAMCANNGFRAIIDVVA
ncbi:KH domain-containing protein [Bdellovibrio sp. 22V]|uniref:KH domain-containing protein n=1 Tax=Bdellovibrio TaxID=958 RepID=UPI0025432789|nr:KH domain-containing protein [Bdellovibrio sp. 22V]WII72673.1 KH domain-containing protein [Bdellovibrio sp. 22V]